MAITPTVFEPTAFPDTSLLVTEDGKPVDNLFVEKQYRLLTEPLWTSWKSPAGRPFRVLANVGLFYEYKLPPLVPDVMFAIDVASPPTPRDKDFRSYFVWIVGKVPDVGIEIVSDKRGGEDTDKLRDYERIRVPYYVVFDPDEILDGGLLRAFGLQDEKYQPMDPARFGELGLGLKLWEGEFEGVHETWLRWIDADGKLIPTGKELADLESNRAEAEAKRAETEAKRAETEAKRAETEAKRAEAAETRIKRLEEKLRSAGITPNGSA